jgi:hypothetical protein
VWFATPSLQETFTLYSLPVSPAHQKSSNDAAFERLKDWLFLPEITGYAGSPFGL